MFPKQKDIEIPLLEVLVELGGEAKPKYIYPLVTKKLPEITEEEELKIKLPSHAKKWHNRVQWVRLVLIKKGEMVSPDRGIWKITDKGKTRLIHAS